MESKNEYSIKISRINSDWINYSVWKNTEDIDPDDLTIEEWELFQKELFYFSEVFKYHIKNLKEL